MTYETLTTMTFKLKTDQTMMVYLGQYNFEPKLNHTRERHLTKVGKMVPYMCHFKCLYLCNDRWILLIFDTQAKKSITFCATNGYCQILLTFWAIWRQNFDNFILGHTIEYPSIRKIVNGEFPLGKEVKTV